MKLVADSGSTTCGWCLLGGAQPQYFSTQGYNPYFVDTAAIVASLRREVPAAALAAPVREVFFYGSGVLSAAKAEVVAAALRQVWPGAAVQVAEDLLGAARALLGRQPGLAAILGTGTNSCLYDGQRITQVVEGLGYSLGDEGCGTHIGRQLLRDYLRGRLPDRLGAAFRQQYQLGELPEVLDHLYNRPLPNRFLAGFARFAGEHYAHPYCQQVVAHSMEAFFEQIITHYPDYQRYALHCVGSVGYHFREALGAAAARHGMALGTVLPAPIEALARYHG